MSHVVIPGERSETRDPGPHDGWLPHATLGPGSRAGTGTARNATDIDPRLAGMTSSPMSFEDCAARLRVNDA